MPPEQTPSQEHIETPLAEPTPEVSAVVDVPIPQAPKEEAPGLLHTFEGDLARAMNTSEAGLVQDLLTDARNREAEEKDIANAHKTRGWYIIGSIILILVAIAAAGYAYYHYRSLTVSLAPSVSVGVFPTTTPIVASSTDIRQTLVTISEDTSLIKDRPALVPVVDSIESRNLLPIDELYAFLEIYPDGALKRSIQTIRLGAMNTGLRIAPFVIFSVPDAEIASKELLLSEPRLLEQFYQPLGIDLSTYKTLAGNTFESKYVYNLPVRMLSQPTIDGEVEQIVMLYGYVTPKTIVLTQDPAVLRGVYDTLAQQ